MLTTLTISLVHFSLKGWENVLFELGSDKVRIVMLSSSFVLPNAQLCACMNRRLIRGHGMCLKWRTESMVQFLHDP